MIMAGIGYVFLLIAGIIDIILVVKIFQKEGALKGIFAFFCSIYAYIWGWQHAKELNLGRMMWIMTGSIILGSILYGIGAPSMMVPPTGGDVVPSGDVPTVEPTAEGIKFFLRSLGA